MVRADDAQACPDGLLMGGSYVHDKERRHLGRDRQGGLWQRIHADALMAANPEHIDTFRFSAGVVLKTPTVEDARAGTLPPWKYEAQYE